MLEARSFDTPLKFAHGRLLAPETLEEQMRVLWLGALIRARVKRLDKARYSASVAPLDDHPQAEFSSLLEAQGWCEAEIERLLLETKVSLEFSRTRGVCSRLFERSFL